jgi:hypothetical protein
MRYFVASINTSFVFVILVKAMEKVNLISIIISVLYHFETCIVYTCLNTVAGCLHCMRPRCKHFSTLRHKFQLISSAAATSLLYPGICDTYIIIRLRDLKEFEVTCGMVEASTVLWKASFVLHISSGFSTFARFRDTSCIWFRCANLLVTNN